MDWENPSSHPAARQEPRRGARAALRCTVHCGGTVGDLVVYCLHAEVYCGMLARMKNFADVLTDARRMLHEHAARPIAIMGDLNTMAHGIARLSPRFCCDRMRVRSLCLYEAQVWDRHVFRNVGGQPSAALRAFGLPADVCAALVNPGALLVVGDQLARSSFAGFVDPFDVVRDVTLDHPTYRLCGISLMKGKLDWCVLQGAPLTTICTLHAAGRWYSGLW